MPAWVRAVTLEALTYDALGPFRHGFFTRRGGASSGVYSGLNCGMGSHDISDAVAVNMARVATHFNLGADQLVRVRQTHSNIVHVLDGPSDPLHEGDAIVSNTKGVALAILTADCQPILMACAASGTVAAVHAGWRGAQSDIIEATVAQMEALGALRDQITAVIGPSISQVNYEVGQELYDAFLADDAANTRFFAQGQATGKYQFDLPLYGLHKLRAAGLGSAQWCGECTYADDARFYSYRRATHRGEPDYGRLISVICP